MKKYGIKHDAAPTKAYIFCRFKDLLTPQIIFFSGAHDQTHHQQHEQGSGSGTGGPYEGMPFLCKVQHVEIIFM